VLQQMEAWVAKQYKGDFDAYFNACLSKLDKACSHNQFILPKELRENSLVKELCGIVSVFSDFAGFSKKDLLQFISALEEKAAGSERNFFDFFFGLDKLRKDIYKFSATK
jgi:hypothetical protein